MLDQEKDQKFISLILLGIGCIFLVFAIVFYFSRSGVLDLSVTETNISAPNEVIVSNIGSNTATISWFSESPAKGYIKYGRNSNSLTSTGFNTRDPSGQLQNRNVHYVRLSNLNPGTEYFFEIYLNDMKFDNSGQLYKFKTLSGSTVATPVTLLISLPPTFIEGVVYAVASDGSQVSSIASSYTSSANASIDLSVLKNDSGQPFKTDSSTAIKIAATSSNGTRFEKILSGDSTRAIIESAKTVNSAFEPRSVFSVIANEPITPPNIVNEPTPSEEEIINEEEVNPPPQVVQQPQTPTQLENENVAQSSTLPPAGNNLGAVTQIPATAIGEGELSILIQLFIGFLLIILGVKLVFKKNS